MHYDRIVEETKAMTNVKNRIVTDLENGTFPKLHRSAEIIDLAVEALEGGRPFSDVMNYRNLGQVREVPMDTVVETFVNIDAIGVHPVIANPLPKAAATIVRDTAMREELFMEAAMEWDEQKLISALSIDPLVMDFRKVKDIVKDIMEYNVQFLPKGWI